MKGYILTFATLLTLTAGAVTSANAVEFGVGPNGVYVGPRDHHDRYREFYGRDRDCRVVVTHRTNRFGEDVTVRRRICD